MIRIKTQKVLHNLGNIFKMNTFLTVLPRAAFRTQSKVYGGTFFAKIVNDFQLLTLFAKKAHHKCYCVGCKEKRSYCEDIVKKFCSYCFRQACFHLGVRKSGCWSRQIVMIEWEFAWAYSVLVVWQRWSFEQV